MNFNYKLLMITFYLFIPGVASAGIIDHSAAEKRSEERRLLLEEIMKTVSSVKSFEEWPEGKTTLDKWMTHKDEDIRGGLVSKLYYYAADNQCNQNKRREIILFLIQHMNDSSQWIHDRIVEWLMNFDTPDFNNEAIRLLKERFEASGYKYYYIRLMGIVDLDYCYEKTKEYLELPDEQFGSIIEIPDRKRAAMFVAARRGDKECIKYLINLYISENKRRPYRISFDFSFFRYIPQPEVIEFLNGYLLSDEKTPDYDDVRSTYVAQWAAQSLSVMLKGFPEYDNTVFQNDMNRYIDACREWMGKQKQWEFKKPAR